LTFRLCFDEFLEKTSYDFLFGKRLFPFTKQTMHSILKLKKMVLAYKTLKHQKYI